jgi:hypothetical protein
MKGTIEREWGKYLGSKDWDLYLTFHYYHGCKVKRNRQVMEGIYKRNQNVIERMFFVSERSSNYYDVHSHVLIKTSSISEVLTNINPLNSLCNISKEGINNEIRTDEGVLKVGYYVSKFLEQGVDYDLL